VPDIFLLLREVRLAAEWVEEYRHLASALGGHEAGSFAGLDRMVHGDDRIGALVLQAGHQHVLHAFEGGEGDRVGARIGTDVDNGALGVDVADVDIAECGGDVCLHPIYNGVVPFSLRVGVEDAEEDPENNAHDGRSYGDAHAVLGQPSVEALRPLAQLGADEVHTEEGCDDGNRHAKDERRDLATVPVCEHGYSLVPRKLRLSGNPEKSKLL
jgi:hypothetical protein